MSHSSLIRAAGGIVHRPTAEGVEVLLVQRPRYDDWTLPKGKLDPNESFAAAALREVREETGCAVQLGDYAGYITYSVNGTPKIVHYWKMTPLSEGPVLDPGEVAAIEWLAIPAAIDRLSHPSEKALLTRLWSPALDRHS